MMLSEGDRKVIIGCLQWAAMEFEKKAQLAMRTFDTAQARRDSVFSVECARLADLFQKG